LQVAAAVVQVLTAHITVSAVAVVVQAVIEPRQASALLQDQQSQSQSVAAVRLV
jgi:hypothetical protein